MTYVEKAPSHAGFWWMRKPDGTETVVELRDPNGALWGVGLNGNQPPLSSPIFDDCLWSSFSISKPNIISQSRVRAIMGDRSVEIILYEREMIQSIFPDQPIINKIRSLLDALFKPEIEDRMKMLEMAMKRHSLLADYCKERYPYVLPSFLAECKHV